jgi:hypothetical protein
MSWLKTRNTLAWRKTKVTDEEFRKMLGEMHSWEVNMQEKKSHDYADNHDTLSNFKLQTRMCDALSLPEANWATCARMIVLKLIRYCNLANKGGDAMNESLLDTVGDLRQYALLMEACRQEEGVKIKYS